jgi:hypothetical protein
MKIELGHLNGICIAEITSDAILLTQAQDALELAMNCSYQGADAIIVHESNVIPAFFDLRTGIAGEVLQKFSLYRIRLAIVGDFSKHTSNSLQAFITESNRTGFILFVSSVEIAKERLAKS